ncbi:vacuolar protein [Cryptococcus neoformans Tu259-1]|uniref:Vacuolar protein n=1 Tax=Cryptococcus neoformans Tu259-1 TaxID=1230072 RepID=A0A854Q8E5_CRYNE|nr:vacuolar protein [Cryptococcus neoformans var. grubii Tu259-1]
MCCEADWKREVVPDHKFDFINVKEFHKGDIWTRIKYILRYVFLLKSVAVYALDIFTAVTMVSSDHWTNAITSKCDSDCVVDVQFKIAKWVFVGCIIFSFLLLAYETYKAKRVIDSRDISYAFTNLLANDYYSFRSYDNFCLFCQIESSSKKKDDLAFFIFFTFKGWKRLLLADGPRQSINAILLYSFAAANNFQTSDIPAYWDNSLVTALLLFSMIFTVLVFAGSLLLLIVAAVTYIPLLCYIQGNLKEYVCHKIDKRIADLIKKKQRQRIARAAAIDKKRAMAGGVAGTSMGRRTSKDGGSDLDGYGYGRTPQPTLPQVSLDDEDYQDDIKLRAKIKAERAGMNFPSSTPAPNEYPPAPPAMGGEYGMYHEYGSSTSLVGNAAPLGISYPPSVVIPGPGGPAPPHSNSMSSLPSLPSYSSVNVNAENRQQQAPPPLPHSNSNSNSLQSISRYTPGGQGQPSGRVSPYDRHDQYGHYDHYDSYDSYTQDYFSQPLIVQPPLPPASQLQPQPQPQLSSSSSSTSQPYTLGSYQLQPQTRVVNGQGYTPAPTPGYVTRDQYMYDTSSSAYGGYGGR